MRKVLIILFILIVLFILYGFYINPKGFKVNEYSITSDKISSNFDGLKIIHFSDVLLGSTTSIDDLKEVAKKINDLKGDIVVFTGDLFGSNTNISESDKTLLKETLNSIDCTLYKYAVIGDNDKKYLDNYKEIMNEANFQILDDEISYLFYKDKDPIKLIGITDVNNFNTINNDEEGITPSYVIVLSHYSDVVNNLPLTNIDLVLSGNSLNGQIRLPFIGGLIKKEGSEQYIDSHYTIDNTELYISSGLGCESINFRTFNKPAINSYVLYTKTNLEQ